MALTRLDIGAWHYVQGTENEVLTELKNVRVDNIIDIATNNTTAIFCRGNPGDIAGRRSSLTSKSKIKRFGYERKLKSKSNIA